MDNPDNWPGADCPLKPEFVFPSTYPKGDRMDLNIKRNPNEPIDVLLIAKNDWANTGARFWRCLLSLGLNAVMVKGEKHPFQYNSWESPT